ncbi:hypothetical protein RhiirC2_871418 [Rhizophagus irregularis]|uniref:Uncharacterized protein n=1 Tax=Rhizophagus irregularis TaxID=588596 RepID=A0A2N1MBB5_9GLOM|nr:hypothetical protein RhiirC2_871418 [Rhizophagus irregularis]
MMQSNYANPCTFMLLVVASAVKFVLISVIGGIKPATSPYSVNIRFQLVQYHDSSAIKKYFSPRIVQEIHKQMCESVLYKCEQLPLNEAFEFIDDQLDQDEFNEYNANSNDDQIDMSNQNEEKIENIEDYYDFRQIYLKALISSVLRKLIKEVWYVIPYMVPTSYQHILIFNDRTHLCTCLLLVSHGIIYRHYFKFMIENSNALFHIVNANKMVS